VAITPAIREFLVELEALLDRKGIVGEPPVTAAGSTALVGLGDTELEIDDRRVIVRYAPEQVTFTSREEALRFIEMIADRRVELEVSRNGFWTTMRSYRDGQTVPFRRTRMPWPTLRRRIERRVVELRLDAGLG
jgi:hypothetical protein